MPNWVTNTITATGDPADVDAFAAAVRGPHDSDADPAPLSFQAVLPRPADQDENWYDWNSTQWGTKWDACEGTVLERSPGVWQVRVDTAWAPPTGVLEALPRKFPALRFALEYEEEQGFGARAHCEPGEGWVIDERWDIPQSHQELVGRGRACWCDDEYAVFRDCFVERAREAGASPRLMEAVQALASDSWEGTFDDLLAAAGHLSA